MFGPDCVLTGSHVAMSDVQDIFHVDLFLKQ
jgi:hypothetical protein